MDPFYDRLITRAATIDELLSDDFEVFPGDKGETGLAQRRFTAWCRSAAGGDGALFARRLARDGLDSAAVLARLEAARHKASAPTPRWAKDSVWILAALEKKTATSPSEPPVRSAEPFAFEHLLAGVVSQAEALLKAELDGKAAANLEPSAYQCLRHALFQELCDLAAPALYERFSAMRKANEAAKPASHRRGLPKSLYEKFVAEMRAGGFRQLFEEKPVLLRLISTISRQWVETSREFIVRLDADRELIRDALNAGGDGKVAKIDGGFSDPHNNGRSVKIVTFADGLQIAYKPKDLRVDVAWQKLIDRLNRAKPPIDLMTANALARDGYGWTACIDHATCASPDEFKTYFERVGAWLALFHCFAANDMHQENIVASGSHPVPIDLETVLQSAGDKEVSEPEDAAFDSATERLADSVMATGLLPAYGRAPDDKIFAIGGVTADWNTKIKIKWENVNSDDMRPTRWKDVSASNPNLPHVNGRYAKSSEHIDDLIAGFDAYARFLLDKGRSVALFDGFSGLSVRKVVRATRFYAMLLQRLKNHKTMDDGATWSAQADFMARLADWDTERDPLWPIQRAERTALLTLNIPHFVSETSGSELRDLAGLRMPMRSTDGLTRARGRFENLDRHEIDWQVEIVRVNTSSLRNKGQSPAPRRQPPQSQKSAPADSIFRAEAQRIANELSGYAIRRGPAAAWIGLDWLGDAEVFQLVTLGNDLYNGVSGIALFLSAHAAVTGQSASRDLALAGVARLRKQLRSRSAARLARSLGLGGATGLGSVIYAMTVMAHNLADAGLRADAHHAAGLVSDELIAADKRLDVIAGSAGAILCLLRLYRDGQSEAVLHRATKCGDHLLAQHRPGETGRRSWVGQGSGPRPLNGMSHGAGGFAYALASLSAATGREDFAAAAQECIDFENSSFSPQQGNWPDLRVEGSETWPCQWCHGAPGIGLARVGMARLPKTRSAVLTSDVQTASETTQAAWPSAVDTLCCGTLGSIEFLCEAGDLLGRNDLRDLARRQMGAVVQQASASGDYRWNSGERRFNLGLFRGMAGVGYSALRQVDPSLPNVLIFE